MERTFGGYIDMSQDLQYDTLPEAEGSIQAGPEQMERLDEATERLLGGGFHVSVEQTIVVGCIDGRCGCSLKPTSAGGTESLMVADDLINKQFRGNDGSTAAAYDNVLAYLAKNKRPIGGHDDAGSNDVTSGCGANDKLPLIYDMIARKGDYIRELATEYGINVDDETHERITVNASARTEFSSGAELRNILNAKTAGEFDHLEGTHKEVVIVLNTVTGTTLDRDAMRREFGDEYQAFNVDVWAFQESANIISTTPDSYEATQKVAAMAYYNFATALTLCGPGIRIIVR